MFSSFTEADSERPEYQSFAAFVRLTREKRQLLAEVKKVEAKLDALEYQLRDYLGVGGWEKVDVDGFSVFLRRQIYVNPRAGVSAAAVVAALKENGMEHFVKEQYNKSTLSDHVRELEEQHQAELDSGELKSVGELLPPDLVRLLQIDPIYSVIAMAKKKVAGAPPATSVHIQQQQE